MEMNEKYNDCINASDIKNKSNSTTLFFSSFLFFIFSFYNESENIILCIHSNCIHAVHKCKYNTIIHRLLNYIQHNITSS